MKTKYSYTIVFLMLGLTGLISDVSAQGKATANAGPDGIFIFAGREFPKDFSYQVSRKTDRDKNWEVVGMLTFPSSIASLQGKLFTSAGKSENVRIPDDKTLARVWSAISKGRTADSLYSFGSSTAWLAAAGNGTWDKSIRPNVSYSYKVQKLDKKGIPVSEEITTPVKFPGSLQRVTIKASGIRTTNDVVTADFILQSSEKVAGCNVYRSDYMRNNFREIIAQVSYYQNKEGTHISVEDATVQNKMMYSYFLKPYDTWGNLGPASDTLHVYNADARDIASKIIRFRADSLVKEKAIRVSWKIEKHPDIVSVDLYKGVQYDRRYIRIGSFASSDSVYIDRAVNPINTYLYTLVLNTAFGRSFPSGRISGMLPASGKNLFPPVNVTAVRQGNVVNLTWSRTEGDTRGYYVYRADGFTNKMQQVSSLILSDEPEIHFTDSLSKLPPSSVWVYAIADVNSSYGIGPLSEKVSVTGNNAFMPVPSDLSVLFENNVVQLLWSDLSEDYPGVSGYWVFRRAEDMNGKEVEHAKKINASPLVGKVSSYTDSSATDGFRYYYSIQAIGLDPSEVSIPGPEVGILIPEQLPLAPANIRGFHTDKGIVLQWDLPFDPSIAGVRIYRTMAGEEWKLVKSLDRAAGDFTDSTAKKNTTYFFRIATVNVKGRENRNVIPVGVRAGN